ncbi:protein kinase domain-containing protein [Paracoccus pacificus]|uniref:Protein kinase n=1 Tax=Paracoccus pacificus TaxID=1463598 RepID=A0ABW4R710_9RHOB
MSAPDPDGRLSPGAPADAAPSDEEPDQPRAPDQPGPGRPHAAAADKETNQSAAPGQAKPDTATGVDAERTRIATPAAGAPDDDRTRISTPPSPHPSLPGRTAAEDRTRILIPEAATPEDAPVVAPGTLINNNYRIREQISAGGMGEVYLAENVFTGDPVAVKIALPELARDEAIVALFRREARILGQLSDDAIVRYHNFVLDQGLGRYCLIMEYIDGIALWDRVQTSGPMPAAAAARMMRRLAAGLAKAHARGVTHRDLSPDNVMLRGDDVDHAVLIDFGIARSAEMGDGLQGRFAGKFKYVAPEQLGHHGGEIGPAADIYGMALMLAAVLRGAPLEMGSTTAEAAAVRTRIPDLSSIPPDLFPLLQHMLEPAPAARPASMDAVVAMLDDPTRIPARYRLPLWVDQEAPAATPDQPGTHSGTTGIVDSSDSPFGPVTAPQVIPEPGAAPRVRWPLFAGLAAGVAALAAAGAFFALRPAPAPPEDPGTVTQQGAGNDLAANLDRVLGPRDPATRDGWLAAQTVPACTHVFRVASGVDAGRIGVLADGARDLRNLRGAYDKAFSASPALADQRVLAVQCPAVDFVRALAGRTAAPPVLSLDSQKLVGDGTVVGRLTDTGGRATWLFLVSSEGQVHDLSPRLQTAADGSQTFSFNMALKPGSGATPQMIVAVVADQPLTAPATAPAGAEAATLLPAVLDEIAAGNGKVAVDQAYLQMLPAPPSVAPPAVPPAAPAGVPSSTPPVAPPATPADVPADTGPNPPRTPDPAPLPQ